MNEMHQKVLATITGSTRLAVDLALDQIRVAGMVPGLIMIDRLHYVRLAQDLQMIVDITASNTYEGVLVRIAPPGWTGITVLSTLMVDHLQRLGL